MLEDAITKKQIVNLPYQVEFDRTWSRLSALERGAIEAEINQALDAILVGCSAAASWAAAGSWAGTPRHPIWAVACRQNEEAAAMFYGNIFKQVVIGRSDLWRIVKQPKSGAESNGVEIALYWRAS